MKTEKQIREIIQGLKDCRLYYAKLQNTLRELKKKEDSILKPDYIAGSYDMEIEICFNDLNDYCFHIIRKCVNLEDLYGDILRDE